jgi:hypothetical protein
MTSSDTCVGLNTTRTVSCPAVCPPHFDSSLLGNLICIAETHEIALACVVRLCSFVVPLSMSILERHDIGMWVWAREICTNVGLFVLFVWELFVIWGSRSFCLCVQRSVF